LICGEGDDLKAHLKVDLKVMSNGPIEILGARERRRRWSVEEKLRLVAECDEPDAVLRSVAARHDIYPNLLRTWRRQARQGQLRAEQSLQLLPVQVTETPMLVAGASASRSTKSIAGTIEITLPDGCRVNVGNDVTLAMLRRVMTVLRG
jgi:transposase